MTSTGVSLGDKSAYILIHMHAAAERVPITVESAMGNKCMYVYRVTQYGATGVMHTEDWARGEVRLTSGFTVKTSPEAAARPSEA